MKKEKRTWSFNERSCKTLGSPALDEARHWTDGWWVALGSLQALVAAAWKQFLPLAREAGLNQAYLVYGYELCDVWTCGNHHLEFASSSEFSGLALRKIQWKVTGLEKQTHVLSFIRSETLSISFGQLDVV